ncbi:glycoside hydrolase family 18 protein [Penicillium taxi]|uniref:glycoside hydrolase family 18 protein n=1 Tax=Penicillium taxi TaxID=168475 RepID=UPI002544DEF6|nr:glycoside hydrolase family 18 protein [Penicillium taxi]KAJ5901471.1 glycoside hydrolase family 18 protein [Penicillium taxi]
MAKTSDYTLDLLTDTFKDGQLIKVMRPSGAVIAPLQPDIYTVEGTISKALFAYAIPYIWSFAGTRAFIINSGYDCDIEIDLENAEDIYLSTDLMNSTGLFMTLNCTILLIPMGKASSCRDIEDGTCYDSIFSKSLGLSTLDGLIFGGVILSDLITSSLNTYVGNGNANGASKPDLTDSATNQ